MKINQFGRSMIEMLGVLAIIGVLSVGAIAGYQKAMMKYKLNKHLSSINFLINTVLQYKDSFPKAELGKTLHYNKLLFKLKALPDNFTYISSEDIINENIFNTPILILHNREENNNHGFIQFELGKQSDYMADICRNILFAAKENSNNLWLVQSSTKIDGVQTINPRIFGDDYCKDSNNKCLSSLTINDTENICSNCAKDNNCYLHILFK
ncbi:MAG: hypothetical protein IKI97_03535 [Clostridia bacterium]|nr:hypothetical protein [Clostridia bacterium]